MPERKAKVGTQLGSRVKAKDLAKISPFLSANVGREKHFRFGRVNFLIRDHSELLNCIPNAFTVQRISLCKKKESSAKKRWENAHLLAEAFTGFKRLLKHLASIILPSTSIQRMNR